MTFEQWCNMATYAIGMLIILFYVVYSVIDINRQTRRSGEQNNRR